MNIETLREFVTFANYLNFSSAAKALHISQPALSNHMAELEKEVGAALINRAQPLSLTLAGRILCEDSSKIVSACDAMVKRCRSAAHGSSYGRLVVKTPVVLGYDNGLTVIVEKFRKANPGADIRFTSGVGQTLLEQLKSGTIDCGVFYGFHPTDLVRNDDGAPIKFVTIGVIPIAAIMRPENKLAQKERLSPLDFDGVRYPMPSGAMYEEFRISADDMIKRYNLRPITYLRPVNSFQEFPHSINSDEVFLFSPMTGAGGVHLVSRGFNPEIMQTVEVAVSVDHNKPVSISFFEFLERVAEEAKRSDTTGLFA